MNKVIEILIILWYIVYRWGKPHTIKKGIPSFEELGTIPKILDLVPTLSSWYYFYWHDNNHENKEYYDIH